MTRQDLLKALSNHAKTDPAILGDALSLIGSMWKEATAAQDMRRESKHLCALSDMLDNLWALTLYKKKSPELWSNMQCCTILDACDAVMPYGKGCSPAQTAVLAHLAKSCRALGWKPEDDFIRNIRGKDGFLKGLYANNPEDKND